MVGLRPVIDGPVLLVTMMAAVLAAVLFALVPGWQAARVSPAAQLQGSGRTVAGSRPRQRLRASLVVVETALALVLLVAAGLLLRSLAGLQQVSPGFETRDVLLGGVALPERTYAEPERRVAFVRALLGRLRESPAIWSAAAGTPLPFTGNDSSASFDIEGVTPGPGDPGPHGKIRVVTPEYFSTLSIPLRRGRVFTEADRLGGDPVLVIDENLARRYWPAQDPIGRRMRFASSSAWMTIVGVVGHVLHDSLAGETDEGTYYRCFYQEPDPRPWVVARLKPGAPAPASIIGAAVRSLDPSLPVQRVGTMDDRVTASLASRRFVLRMLVFFSAMALLLAALGLYGVISHSVAQRTQEIGVRMALGADRRSVLWLVLREGATLAGAGVVVGAVGSAVVARLIASQLFTVSPFDPTTFIGMVVLLLATAIVATWLPARQASRVDPLHALRYE